MTQGRFIAVVGPSGVGKDSVMAALASRDARFAVVRRMITRPDEAVGEDHTSVTEAEFDRIENAGGFAVSWRAHGLSYGIPSSAQDDIAQGRDVLANLSRGVLAAAQARFARFAVLSLTAPVEVLAQRLAGRGRETDDQIADRLSLSASPLPKGLPVISVENAGPLDQTVDEILTRLQPQRA
ncbi:phosphonate metabolism protein/1,5-bisphosphokinase (PRPP-forming) PhnN [Antarctobacter heliothermus]|uniref:Ribose 1,5-bisphosphate phosphokinase PhnN n=1 Tax=Antarctobacter heliothermus TaxID=74033 RepID=A0A239KM43_9RHOB|nr:phosphonate metabolism protein/1,5-bisphosphokinase (PRPP-forming) PhnN [Antarctobacter heliothermus]SNT19467.1 ribose 1,5-bisphosphokinase [Antarctobacter heliothermus]